MMGPPLDYYAYACLFNFFTTGLFTFYVISKKPELKLARLFCIFSAGVAIWSLFYFIFVIAPGRALAEFSLRACMIPVAFIPASFLHFVTELVQKKVSSWMHGLNYVFGGVIALTIYTDLFAIGGAPRHLVFPYWLKPGPIFPIHVVHFVGVVIIAHVLLLKAIHESSGLRRAQILMVFWGMSIGFASGIMNYLTWYRTPIPPILLPLVSMLVFAMGYAIVRHQLMDIRVTVTRTGLLLAIYLFVLGAPFVAGWRGRSWFESWFGQEWWLVPLGLCTALATAGPFAYAYLRRQAEERLLKEQRRYQRTLQHAARGMTQVRNVTKLAQLITKIVSRSVRITHASLFLWDKTHQRFVLWASHGPKRLALQSRYRLESDHPLVRWLLAYRKVLNEDELALRPEPAVSEEMGNLGAALVVPGLMEDRLIGLLALGPKLSGAMYSADDLHAFSTLANEAAIAIENASSYEELLKLNAQLKAASDRLLFQERLAAAGQFATGMAHEIKNPLAAIKTFAQYLPEKYKDPAFREKFFHLVQSEIDRISDIVKQLSEFAKPAPLDLQPVQLSALVKDTLDLLSNQCLKQGVEVETAFSGDGLTVQADTQQFRQVLLNLLLNSLESMARGGRLRVATLVRGNRLTLQIADTGCGIGPERCRQVWDPFFTTKERGMGLGLSIVKGIVERHGGEVTLSSAVGKGTTIEITLPVSPR